MNSIYVSAVEERNRLAGELCKMHEELDAARRRNTTLEMVERQLDEAQEKVTILATESALRKDLQLKAERERDEADRALIAERAQCFREVTVARAHFRRACEKLAHGEEYTSAGIAYASADAWQKEIEEEIKEARKS